MQHLSDYDLRSLARDALQDAFRAAGEGDGFRQRINLEKYVAYRRELCARAMMSAEAASSPVHMHTSADSTH